MSNVTIYSKKECHLCDIAKDELYSMQRELDFGIVEVDIENDNFFFEKFKNLIPVVEVDGNIISHYKVDEKKLRKILRQKSQPL